MRENNLEISHPIFGPSLNGPQSTNPHHSCAMPRGFLNRSVQIQPKSWREIVQVIFSQVLTKEGSEKPQKLPTRFGEEPKIKNS